MIVSYIQDYIKFDDKTQDIVQGLPKVEELFEARKPKDSAITYQSIDGTVDVH